MNEIKIESLKKIKQKSRIRNFFGAVGAGVVILGLMAGSCLALVACEIYVLVSKNPGGYVYVNKILFSEMFTKFLGLMFALFLIAWVSIFIKSILKKRKLRKIGSNPVESNVLEVKI